MRVKEKVVMVGAMLSEREAAALRAHVRAQHTNVSEYLRRVAVEPLLEGQDGAHEAEQESSGEKVRG